jgi:hypothetical protein
MAFVEWLKKIRGINLPNSVHSSLLTKTYNGSAVVCTEEYGGVHYIDTNRLSGKITDNITQWTCHFGYNNGHPCMFIRFDAINAVFKNSNYVLCLEWENNRAPFTPRPQALNVYKRNEEKATLNPSLSGITYISMANVGLNTTYCIYIVANDFISRRGVNNYWKLFSKPDWHVRLRVRPCIRRTTELQGTTKAYDFQKNLIDFTDVDYLLIDEYKI